MKFLSSASKGIIPLLQDLLSSDSVNIFPKQHQLSES